MLKNEAVQSSVENLNAEEKLKETEGIYRKQFEEAMDAIFLADAETGIIIDCNRAATKLVGREKSEIIGKHQRILHPPEKIEGGFTSTFKQHLKEKEGQVLEAQVITKNGEIKDVAIKANVLELGNKTILQGIFRDITERKKVEEALNQERVRLEVVTQNLNAGLTVISKDHRILWANKFLKDIYGDLEGKICYETYSQRTSVCPGCGVKEIFETGKNLVVHEQVVPGSDGQNVWLELTATPIRDENGNITAALELAVSIDERKEAEEKIRASEDRYRNLVELAPDIIMTFDLKGRVTSCNAATTIMSGYSKDELVGKHFSKIAALRARDIPKYLSILNSVVRGKVPEPFEVVWKDKNGMPHFGEVHSSLIKEKDKIVGVQAMMSDITERKQMEEKLRQYSEHLEELVQKRTEELLESEKRYSVLVEEASDGVAILQDGKIVFTNKKGTEIVGYSKEEMIGLPFGKLVSEEYRQLTKERYERRLQGENVPSTYEIELITKTGNPVPIELSATRIQYQGRPADLLVVRDISERKQMEETRRRLEKLAAIGELAAMVGHDLRNPLQAIENAAYYLNTELPCLSPPGLIPQKIMEMLQVIDYSINYADKIIRDLRDFSTAIEPTLAKTNINILIKEILSQVKSPQNIELSTELDELPEIKVDENQMRRVFHSLIMNGIQAMESGGTLTVATKQTNGLVEIGFKDTGIGIPKENMDKLFKPLFTTKAKGMGMGLAICKKFVNAHGGKIEVESEVGKGTTVTIKLPIQQENASVKKGLGVERLEG